MLVLADQVMPGCIPLEPETPSCFQFPLGTGSFKVFSIESTEVLQIDPQSFTRSRQCRYGISVAVRDGKLGNLQVKGATLCVYFSVVGRSIVG